MRLSMFALLLSSLSAIAGAAPRQVPELNVILNDDGDLLFLNSDPQASIRSTKASIDAFRGTPIRTLMLCVGAGSDILTTTPKLPTFTDGAKRSGRKNLTSRRVKKKCGIPALLKNAPRSRKAWT